MFIDTLEFTIPLDLCSLYTSLQQGPNTQIEFPASVNSYGTTQDASVQVALRANKVTFKVDGVSSSASMISKSECRTLKLSVFDVDRSLMPQNTNYSNNVSFEQHSQTVSVPTKRHHEQSVSLPPAKNMRTSYTSSPSSRPRSPGQKSQPRRSPHSTEHSQQKSQSDSFLQSKSDIPVNVKQEPEDPDLIEIEPDDIEPKKETPYMQIDYSSSEPRTHTSQAALDRLSQSYTQSPASSSSSFHQNVPHVQDYPEPGPSHGNHGDQSADDYLVFQDDNDYAEDNEADYSNDGSGTMHVTGFGHCQILPESNLDSLVHHSVPDQLAGFLSPRPKPFGCKLCQKSFASSGARAYHVASVHENKRFPCICGKVYIYESSQKQHMKKCDIFMMAKNST